MKSIYISLLFCGLFISAIHGQELFIHGGKSVTTFQFKDVLSIELQDLQSTNHSYIDVGYRGKLFTEAINWVGEFGVHTYGATGNDNFQNFLSWETTYLGLAAGIDAELFKVNRFAFHLRATVGPEVMIQGTQVLNNQVFDVLNEQDFDTPFVFLKGAASFEYNATDDIALFCQYRFARGTQINRNDSGADLGYISNDFGIGVIVKLKNKSEEDSNNSTD